MLSFSKWPMNREAGDETELTGMREPEETWSAGSPYLDPPDSVLVIV